MPEDGLDEIIAVFPVGHLGTPDDMACIVTFLTAAEAGWITEANPAINGGSYCH